MLDWWDLFKNSLKAEVIEFSKRARTKSSHSRVLLTNRLIALKRRLSLGDRSVSLEISQVEQDLKFLILVDLEGSKIRSRVLLLEEDDIAFNLVLVVFFVDGFRPSLKALLCR